MGRSFANSNAPVSIDTEMLMTFLGFALLYASISFTAFWLRQVNHSIGGYTIPTIGIASIIGLPKRLFSNTLFFRTIITASIFWIKPYLPNETR